MQEGAHAARGYTGDGSRCAALVARTNRDRSSPPFQACRSAAIINKVCLRLGLLDGVGAGCCPQPSLQIDQMRQRSRST
jgi:hypothetical protein